MCFNQEKKNNKNKKIKTKYCMQFSFKKSFFYIYFVAKFNRQ